MFSPFDYFLWAIAFILEAAGAYFYFRRNKALSAVLAFRAAADFIGFFLSLDALNWLDYFQRMLQYPLLAVLAIDCLGRAVGAHRREIRLYAAPLSALMAMAIAAAHGALPWELTSVLWIEEKTVYFLAAIVCFGWITRRAEGVRGSIDRVSVGLLTLLFSYGLFTTAKANNWMTFAHANLGIQLGSILALGLWVSGASRLTEFRRSLGQTIITAEKVSVC
jgi:hypothetical protein